MYNNSIAGAIALACALVTTQASAADFTGPRVEAHVGYDNTSLDLSDFGLGKGSKGGFAYGIGIGYDFAATPNLIIGVELNADLASTNASDSLGTESAKISAKRDLSALVRIGGKVSDKALMYFKAGYTNARFKVEYRDTAFPADNIDVSANADGIRAGVGFEYAITPKAYAKIEYQYSNYEGGFSRNQGLVGLGFRF